MPRRTRSKSKPRRTTTKKSRSRSTGRRMMTTTSKSKSKKSGGRRRMNMLSLNVGKSLKMPLHAKQHEVRMNPFHGSGDDSWIPDGKADMSLSRRLRGVYNVNSKASANGAPILGVLHPLIGCPMTVFNDEKGYGVRPNASQKAHYLTTPDQGHDLLVSKQNEAKVNIMVAGEDDFTISHKDLVTKWRVVSQGCRLQCINSADENEGWFESITVNWRQFIQDLVIIGNKLDHGISISTFDGAAIGASARLADYADSLVWVEQPSYKRGLLREIHHHKFDLYPVDAEHDFCNIFPESYYTKYVTNDIPSINLLRTCEYIADEKAVTFHRATEAFYPQGFTLSAHRELMSQYCDMNMSWTFIRFHPIAKTDFQTKLVCDVVQNIEYIVAPENDIAAYQKQRPAKHGSAEKVAGKKKDEVLKIGNGM